MRKVLAIIKNSLHTIVAIIAVSVIAIYLITHFNLSGYLAKNLLTGDLAGYLSTEVELENAKVDIFNQIVLDNLLIKDQKKDTLLYVRRAMVAFDLLPLLKKELEIHTIQLIDYSIQLSKQDSLSEPNFQFLVDRFMPKDEDNRRKILDELNVNSIILRSGRLRYDYKEKEAQTKYIDPNHLAFDNISANIKIISTKEEGLFLRLKRLSLEEKSGMTINKASAVIALDPESKRLDMNDIRVQMKQRLDNHNRAMVEMTGFAAMENKQIDAEIIALKAEIPEKIKLTTSIKGEDLLSYKDSARISVLVHSASVKANGLAYIKDKCLKRWEKALEPYIEKIQEISLEGKAKGTMRDFSYEAKAESFGELASDIDIAGKYSEENRLDCRIMATLRNLEIKKHEYKEISIDGTLDKDCFDGKICIDDPLCTLDAEGRYYHQRNRNKVKARVNVENIEPYSLNLTDIGNFRGVSIAGAITADVNFANREYPTGEIRIDSLDMQREGIHFRSQEVRMLGERDGDSYSGDITTELGKVLCRTENEVTDLRLELQDSRNLSQVLRLPLTVTRSAFMSLKLDAQKRILQSELKAPELLYDGAVIGAHLTSINDKDLLKHRLEIDYQKNGNHLTSKIRGTSLFEPLTIDIEPCDLTLNNDIIECGGARLEKTDTKTYDLKHFRLKQKEQMVNAQGKISTDGKSDLKIHIENLGIDTLCSFLDSDYLRFGGIGTGDILYSSDSARTVKTENLHIKDFTYLGGYLGDTEINGNYDIDRTRVELVADVRSKEDSLTRISGYIQIAKKDSLDLLVEANKMNVEFLRYWVGGFLEELEGTLTGDMHLYGLARELKLVGRPYADLSFTNHLSGARFRLKDYITLTKDRYSDYGYFMLDKAKILDRHDQVAFATASIQHRYLRKYNYDVRIDFPDDNAGFLAFDKPTHYNNELYWGQLYTNGTVLLRGGDGKHRIDVNCRTAGKSYFNLSPGEENYSENGYNFLVFRDKEEFEASERGEYSDMAYIGNEEDNDSGDTYIEFDLQAEATENCQVYVQMDPLAEDRLLCRGTGNISLHYDPQHDITIGGVYNISQGNYLVTMRGDLINKEFKIQNGSRVMFPGTFSGAELDINAVYGIPSVNLRDLDESFATMASINRTTLPVDCKLAVTGQLAAPQVAFDLEVKNTSDDVQALVHNLIGTQEMLNREVFYLLLFSKFYTPEYASTSQNNSGSELSSFTSASLTSQLNNLLGHMSDNFTMGTNFRSDKGDFTDMEMDLSLTTRLFSDRLILNGNLGYRDPANRVGMNNNNNSFIGDFDVEYLINQSGTLRAKAYSHYNERDYSINNALTTQGIGFLVRKDFKTIKELLFWKKIKGK